MAFKRSTAKQSLPQCWGCSETTPRPEKNSSISSTQSRQSNVDNTPLINLYLIKVKLIKSRSQMFLHQITHQTTNLSVSQELKKLQAAMAKKRQKTSMWTWLQRTRCRFDNYPLFLTSIPLLINKTNFKF